MEDENNKDCVYAFLYCSCIHESSYATMSLHYSEQGAINAMNNHKFEAQRKFDIMMSGDKIRSSIKFGEFESWMVEPIDILP